MPPLLNEHKLILLLRDVPLWMRVSGVLVVAGLIVGNGYVFLMRPLKAKIALAKHELSELESQVMRTRRLLREEDEIRVRHQELTSALEKIHLFTAQQEAIDYLLRDLPSTGLNCKRVEVVKQVHQDDEQKFFLDLEGSYEDLEHFFALLESTNVRLDQLRCTSKNPECEKIECCFSLRGVEA